MIALRIPRKCADIQHEQRGKKMKIDCHVHTSIESVYGSGKEFDREKYLSDLRSAGLDGSAVFSPSPMKYPHLSVEERMNMALDICSGSNTLFPFFWIDPTDEDALCQVDLAVKRGFVAFKMIPSTYSVASQKALDVIERIARAGKPILFHTGICWDGLSSANNHRPANYEALIEIPAVRFCLAHVSWPWYDECIAVYGKFNNAYHTRPATSAEMFIDVTPGTPRVFREEVFRHLLLSDYELRYNLMFGTDCTAGKYNVAWAKEWQDRDNELYEKYVHEDVEDFKAHVYGKNFLRFIGKSDEVPERKIPLVAQ